ncbi:hypothetical protein SAY86_016496 [Trapa natans]|uniref:Uncharacterized protein n=1 Tax=Trapa natans TaxID=22666 RepID=A0AAN7LDA6_TRANT|nr:hypothetical protein SAY86_016496 [Trapa natans]
MAPLSPFLRWRRYFCTNISSASPHRWGVKQVTKLNFSGALEEVGARISESDFIAVSLQRTGTACAAWHRVSAYDTTETAYLKAKRAAERFQVLQFSVCPFSVGACKVTAHPYNFHLFPRDELKIGMPSFSFSCQTSFLESLVQEDFDFNACIYNGISYLSRSQESAAKLRLGNPVRCSHFVKSPSSLSVADAVFVGRIKYRIKQWKDAYKDLNKNTNDALVRSLSQLVLGGENYGSRPCINIDVCSERQVQLILEILVEFFEELVPLVIPAKGGGIQAVRVILTSSKEDKDLLEQELQHLEDEETRRVRGFREVINLISASQKPIVCYNSLNDFTFIYKMFFAPLPSDVDEFICSLRSEFPQIFDLTHMMKDVVPMEKATNISAARSYLRSRYFTTINMEVPYKDTENEGNSTHGHNVLNICHMFAKLCSILKLLATTDPLDAHHGFPDIEKHANIFRPSILGPCDSSDESVRVWSSSKRRISTQDIVFLWGFGEKMSAGMLKSWLEGSHDAFSENCFNIRFVDKSCAIVVFFRPGLSGALLGTMSSGHLSGRLREMVSEGLKGASYEVYKRICRRESSWEGAELADAFQRAMIDTGHSPEAESGSKETDIYWCSDSRIKFDDL